MKRKKADYGNVYKGTTPHVKKRNDGRSARFVRRRRLQTIAEYRRRYVHGETRRSCRQNERAAFCIQRQQRKNVRRTFGFSLQIREHPPFPRRKWTHRQIATFQRVLKKQYRAVYYRRRTETVLLSRLKRMAIRTRLPARHLPNGARQIQTLP